MLSHNQDVFLSLDNKDNLREIDARLHEQVAGSLCIDFPFISDFSKTEIIIHESSTLDQLTTMIMERDASI